jgi:hypothetical protein
MSKSAFCSHISRKIMTTVQRQVSTFPDPAQLALDIGHLKDAEYGTDQEASLDPQPKKGPAALAIPTA